jgi:LCP family protein required for cell wall assembly
MKVSDPLTKTQPTQVDSRRPAWAESPRKRRGGCCLLAFLLVILAVFTLAIYLWLPGRTNVLLLGLDSRESGSNLARSDTNILITFIPSRPYVGMLSIPRDLWVNIPGYGENRINAAHFFAEADAPGTGAQSAMETVRQNFGVDVHYFVRLRFDGFLDVVDTLDGVDIFLPRPMSGYAEGNYHLDGTQALAFVRDRAGSDDFFRMERGQIFLKALMRRMLEPGSWLQLPKVLPLLLEMIDTDIPVWQWPRLGIALLCVGPDGLDAHSINREMVIPFTTSGGAQVLAPNWEPINPLLLEIFGQ